MMTEVHRKFLEQVTSFTEPRRDFSQPTPGSLQLTVVKAWLSAR